MKFESNHRFFLYQRCISYHFFHTAKFYIEHHISSTHVLCAIFAKIKNDYIFRTNRRRQNDFFCDNFFCDNLFCFIIFSISSTYIFFYHWSSFVFVHRVICDVYFDEWNFHEQMKLLYVLIFDWWNVDAREQYNILLIFFDYEHRLHIRRWNFWWYRHWNVRQCFFFDNTMIDNFTKNFFVIDFIMCARVVNIVLTLIMTNIIFLNFVENVFHDIIFTTSKIDVQLIISKISNIFVENANAEIKLKIVQTIINALKQNFTLSIVADALFIFLITHMSRKKISLQFSSQSDNAIDKIDAKVWCVEKNVKNTK